MEVRLLVLLGVALATIGFAFWWRWRDGRVVEAHGVFDPSDLGLPKRFRGSSATIVEFTGPDCANCEIVKRRLDELATEIGDVTVVAVDAGDRLDLADRYHVRRVPTVFIADDRLRIRWRASGVPSDSSLRSALLGPEWSGRPHPDAAIVDAN